ncbi:MAG: YdjY domain-containing protein [Desulfobacterium sp.]|jgi:hypothetical protein|nr:YdjY domain-containing protein [Desulfobacterium sp.]
MNLKLYLVGIITFIVFLSGNLFLPDKGYSQNTITNEKSPEESGVHFLKTPSSPLTQPEIVEISENILRIGNVLINRLDRSVSIKGEVNMTDGLVEYLACTSTGKLHESILTLFAEPYHIHTALLLLGLIPGDRPIQFQGAPEPPCGDPIKILVAWQTKNQHTEHRPEDLIVNFETKKIMDKTDWVFSGSQMVDGRYMAQVEGSIAAIFHDPFAIVDHRSISGADDRFFHANKAILPPVGTPVEFVIFPEKDLNLKKKVSCSPKDE